MKELLRPKETGNKNIDTPFVVTYHPQFKYLDRLTQNNIKNLMQMSMLDLFLHMHLSHHFGLQVT